MLRQIRLLNSIYLCNVLGLNEARFSKDKKKKNRVIGLAFTYFFLGLMMAFYTGIMAVAYAQIGIPQIIPSYMYTITSLIILFFTIFKSGSVIFNMQTYERTITLPVKPSAIIIARFISMYFSNLSLSLIVMIPSSIVYAVFVKPELSFYFMLIIGTLFLPLIPITIATAIGALILAISSRMKHKNIVSIVISIVFSMLIIAGSMSLSYSDPNTMPTDFSQFSTTIINSLEKVYPPVKLYSASILNGNWLTFISLILISILIFSVLVFIVNRYFISISVALNSSTAKSNYVLDEQKQNSQLNALYKKEMKRYFSSSLYVTNTAIGYIMMIVFSIAVLVMGIDKISSFLPSQDIFVKIIPLLLVFMCVISPSTTSCISIEGKQWWITKSLPIETKSIFLSKILVTLTLAIPSYLLSVILLLFALKPTLSQAVWLIVLPLVYILFTAVIGLVVNLKRPIFNWENETQVIKQSSAVLYSMLIGFLSLILPCVIYFTLSGMLFNLALGVLNILLLIVTYMLYNRCSKINLNTIE